MEKADNYSPLKSAIPLDADYIWEEKPLGANSHTNDPTVHNIYTAC